MSFIVLLVSVICELWVVGRGLWVVGRGRLSLFPGTAVELLQAKRAERQRQRAMRMWSDPWIAAATASGGTRLPPLNPERDSRVFFSCTDWTSLSADTQLAWRSVVGTQLSAASIEHRLANAKVPCLFTRTTPPTLVATCVIRTRYDSAGVPLHMLETLAAHHGFATPLLRFTVRWLYDTSGPFALTYMWELTTLQLLASWLRGWMVSAVEIQRGWVWRRGPNGGPNGGPNSPIMDSGLADGCGYITDISAFESETDWDSVAGHWTHLWARSSSAPPPSKQKAWSWTGEWIVIGCLNRGLLAPETCLQPSTSEIAPR